MSLLSSPVKLVVEGGVGAQHDVCRRAKEGGVEGCVCVL